MRYFRLFVAVLGLSVVLFIVSCGGDSSTSTPPPPPPASVTIDVAPATSSVIITQTQQFTATVANASNTAVTWKVNGTTGGDATVGTISATGLYTAPAKLPNPAQISITATSAADTTKSASGAITVNPYTGIFTFHADNGRTGQNLNETTLTTANVNSTKFGKIFSATVDGQVHAQPLYLSHASIGGQFHNVAYVATEHDTVYAFDADGSSPTPLWTKSLLVNGGIPVPATDYVAEGSPVSPEIGITSTPVIDGTTGTIYVVAATKEGTNYFHRLHALDVATGAEKFGGPVVIQATVPGTGSGASGGQIAFQSFLQLQRPALLLSNGSVFIAFASYNDWGLYHGWVMAYDAATLHQTGVWNATPNGAAGGIWLADCGLSADADGNIYVLTGNGTFDADTVGGLDYGDSFVKLNLTSGGLVVVDSFTPFNQDALNTGDIDLGASGLVLLPDMNGPVTHVGITAGKEGKIYVVNLDDLGKYHTGDDSQIVQSIPNALGTTANGRNLSTAVYWQGNVYYTGHNDVMKQYKVANGLLTFNTQTAHTFGYSAASSLSANGASEGIIWTLESGADVLHAFDANNVTLELWSTTLNTAGGFGRVVRFNPPTIANGKVYIAGQVSTPGQSNFAIFGLLP